MGRDTRFYKEGTEQERGRAGAAIALSRETIGAGESVIVSGTPVGMFGSLRYTFERVSGSTVAAIPDVGLVFSDAPITPGTYTYHLTITSANGQVAKAESRTLTVN